MKEISANDLRVGNLVNLFGLKQGLVLEVRTNHARIKYDLDGKEKQSHVEYDNLEPIPLTKEWLLKLGFVLHNKYSYHNYKLPDGFFISIWMEDEQVAGFEEKGVCYWGDNHLAVRYVHQLQNLYFILTDKELGIKV